MRPHFEWRLRSRTLSLGRRTLLMGILNVTPDSFYDGGSYFQPEAAVAQGLRLFEEGADILDVGGESTRPGARVLKPGALSGAVGAAEELRRILPVIEAILRFRPGALISVDTYKAEVAAEAVKAGAEIVNDISGLSWDEHMPGTAANCSCGVVIMHTRGRPDQWGTLPLLGDAVVELVTRELEESAAAAQRAGIASERIVLDPGFGFGKRLDDNYPLLARWDELQRLGYPLLAATSRKSFIGHTVGRGGVSAPPPDRLYGTLGTVAAAILKGAHIVRVHDMAAARDVVLVCDQILQAEAPQRPEAEG
jgi:dihydropteroate synthase